MSVELLPLCSTPKLAIRDGYTGADARLLLPFYQEGSGYWFNSGQQYTFPGGVLPQVPGLTLSATRQADTFVKAYGVCLS